MEQFKGHASHLQRACMHVPFFTCSCSNDALRRIASMQCACRHARFTHGQHRAAGPCMRLRPCMRMRPCPAVAAIFRACRPGAVHPHMCCTTTACHHHQQPAASCSSMRPAMRGIHGAAAMPWRLRRMRPHPHGSAAAAAAAGRPGAGGLPGSPWKRGQEAPAAPQAAPRRRRGRRGERRCAWPGGGGCMACSAACCHTHSGMLRHVTACAGKGRGSKPGRCLASHVD